MDEIELDILRKILNKVEGLTLTLEDVKKRLHSLEAGLEFIRGTFETNGKTISIVQRTLTVHAREISDLGFEVRGTPTPARVVARKGQ